MRNSVRNILKFGGGVITGLVLAIILPLAVLALGLVDMSATAKPGRIESWLAPWAFDRSMDRRAPTLKNPFGSTPTVLASGLDHYCENCVVCHGAPGVEPEELGLGLNPPAPKLHTADAQELSDGELFWIIKNGIRMTGMPAFGPTHNDEEIWHIVAFVRHLPALTDKEKATLKSVTQGEEEHHHEGAAPGKQAPGRPAPPQGNAGVPSHPGGEPAPPHHDSTATSAGQNH